MVNANNNLKLRILILLTLQRYDWGPYPILHCSSSEYTRPNHCVAKVVVIRSGLELSSVSKQFLWCLGKYTFCFRLKWLPAFFFPIIEFEYLCFSGIVIHAWPFKGSNVLWFLPCLLRLLCWKRLNKFIFII